LPSAGRWCGAKIAVDTNVIVRLLTVGGAKQAVAACSLFAAEPIWIAKTVWLEANWVLRSLWRLLFEAFIKPSQEYLKSEAECFQLSALSGQRSAFGATR